MLVTGWDPLPLFAVGCLVSFLSSNEMAIFLRSIPVPREPRVYYTCGACAWRSWEACADNALSAIVGTSANLRLPYGIARFWADLWKLLWSGPLVFAPVLAWNQNVAQEQMATILTPQTSLLRRNNIEQCLHADPVRLLRSILHTAIESGCTST